jgi:hypothetical protein
MTTTVADRAPVLAAGSSMAEREEALASGAEELSTGRSSLLEDSRLLPTVAASLMTLGLTAILLGWFGAARSTLIEEQVPYLISGGLLGLALALIGALVLFGHWTAVSIKEERQRELARRADHAELMEALHSLAHRTDLREEVANGRPRSPRAERPIRRAPRGS